jgi:soluble lytic murein transglycosylase
MINALVALSQCVVQKRCRSRYRSYCLFNHFVGQTMMHFLKANAMHASPYDSLNPAGRQDDSLARFSAPARSAWHPSRGALYATTVCVSLMISKFCWAEPNAAVQQVVRPVSAAILATDKDILAARDAFDRRDSKTLDTIRQRIAGSGHPLVPYVSYWWFSTNLWQSGASALTQAHEISAFLEANPDTPITEALRRDWLRVLGVADAWHLFAPAVAKYTGDDAEVICHHWRYRLSRNDRDALTEIKSAFVSGKYAVENCHVVYAEAKSLDAISSEDVWARLRRTLEANQPAEARRTAALLPSMSSRFDAGLSAIASDPAKFLSTQKPEAKTRSTVELFLYAITRLARSDAARAATLLEKFSGPLAKENQAYAWTQIGLYGGMQHEPEAVTWFRQAREAKPALALSDTQAAWKARAAMRAQDWPMVREAIEAMSAGERRESGWRYWQARALAATGHPDGARILRESLARELGFYAVLAAEELGINAAPQWQAAYKPNRAELDAALARPAMQRTLALYRLDMKTEGFREWSLAMRGLNDQELLAAAEVARQASIPDRAIGAAVRTLSVHDFAQRFPTPHRSDLQATARANRLDEAWVYGLIRQESRFMADARSRVGAMGLMQLMPATAKWAAGRVGMKNLDLNRVNDVPVNLSLGSYYLRHVLDDLGHPVLATAAYNAGPGRAKRWRAAQPLEGAIYAESIPFNETRDYVKQVMTNAWYYAHRFGGSKVSLKEMMGKVPGRAGGGQTIAMFSVAGGTAPENTADPAPSNTPNNAAPETAKPEPSATPAPPESVSTTPPPVSNPDATSRR